MTKTDKPAAGQSSPRRGFRANGTFLMAERWVPFKLEVLAADEAGARQQVLSLLGSRHRVKRTKVRIGDVVPLDASSAETPLVRQVLGQGGVVGGRYVS